MKPLVVRGDMDLDSRRLLIERCAETAGKLAGAGIKYVTVDCSQVDQCTTPTLGMLVSIARTAQRHGMRAKLDHASVPLRQHIIRAGVRSLFDWET